MKPTQLLNSELWHHRHKLIVEQIKSRGDFDLKQINQIIKEKERENGKQCWRNCGGSFEKPY